MKLHNIKTGQLFTDLDTPFDKESNKIDVYCDVFWTVDLLDQAEKEAEKEYKIKESIINEYQNETDLFTMVAWCDISGFNYWVIQQEEKNYVSIDVVLKKDVDKYTQEEMIEIREAIIKANEYFETILI